jgi:5-methyltetrahydropteroyltriglutamate--homocysteine methyltransferase
MKRSANRILTTHVGSLPRPDDLLDLNNAIYSDRKYDETTYDEVLTRGVAEIVRKQAEVGVDVINDGEFGKASRGATDYGPWVSYAWRRLGGWESGEPGLMPSLARRRDWQRFPGFYAELNQPALTSSNPSSGRPQFFTGPVVYTGHHALQADLANLKAGLSAGAAEEAFITSVAPGSFGRGQNRYYASDEEFLYALADALKTEYRAIVDAGFLLQLDDPGLSDGWDSINPALSVEEYQKFAALRIEAVNYALQGIAEDRVRYHICWGSWHGPHTTDIPLREIVHLLLSVRAGAYSVEAGNARHEHEWRVWQDVKLPPGKVLIPGVVSHATNVVEHPELVAERIVRFANLVGRENVIAGSDCGLGGRVHREVAWAKLEVLVEGARLATRDLWGA